MGAKALACALGRFLLALLSAAVRSGGRRGVVRFIIWAVNRSGLQLSVSAATLAAVYPVIQLLLGGDGVSEP